MEWEPKRVSWPGRPDRPRPDRRRAGPPASPARGYPARPVPLGARRRRVHRLGRSRVPAVHHEGAPVLTAFRRVSGLTAGGEHWAIWMPPAEPTAARVVYAITSTMHRRSATVRSFTG